MNKPWVRVGEKGTEFSKEQRERGGDSPATGFKVEASFFRQE